MDERLLVTYKSCSGVKKKDSLVKEAVETYIITIYMWLLLRKARYSKVYTPMINKHLCISNIHL